MTPIEKLLTENMLVFREMLAEYNSEKNHNDNQQYLKECYSLLYEMQVEFQNLLEREVIE